MPRTDLETLGSYSKQEMELRRRFNNGELPWEELQPWLQHAIEGKFDRLPRNHPLPLTPFTPPIVQWRNIRTLNEIRSWGFTEDEIRQVSPLGEWNLNILSGQLMTRVLVAYFDTPYHTAREWWSIIEESPLKGVVLRVGTPVSFPDQDCFRRRPEVSVPRRKLQWELVNLGAPSTYNPEVEEEEYAGLQVLATAVHHSAWVTQLNGRILRPIMMPGLQVRMNAQSDWDNSLTLAWNEIYGRVELSFEPDRMMPEISRAVILN